MTRRAAARLNALMIPMPPLVRVSTLGRKHILLAGPTQRIRGKTAIYSRGLYIPGGDQQLKHGRTSNWLFCHNCVATPYSTTPQSLSVALTSQLGRGGKGSPVPSLRTLETALQLQRSIFFCLQAFAGVLFIISILLFITRVCIQISKRRAQSWRLIEQGWPEKVLVASVAISVISAASTTQTGNALQFATKRLGAVSLHIKGLPGGEKLTSFPMPPPPPRGLQPPPSSSATSLII
ncbi:hypothetical protein QL093DRAFT_2569519 [Fusarium oxysporum]|nr:hypothetical protein QL093DRAFT_2569519 [Fusarium oxysporum]